MTILKLGPWTADINVEKTRAAYANFAAEAFAPCACPSCRNWRLVHDQAFPTAFRDFLYSAGIDENLEAESLDLGRGDDGLHKYIGAFYVFCFNLHGPTARGRKGEELADCFFEGWPNFSAALSADPEWGLKLHFQEGSDLMQVEFSSRVPWLLPQEDLR